MLLLSSRQFTSDLYHGAIFLFVFHYTITMFIIRVLFCLKQHVLQESQDETPNNTSQTAPEIEVHVPVGIYIYDDKFISQTYKMLQKYQEIVLTYFNNQN